MSTLNALRRFAAALISTTPRRVAEMAIVMLGASAMEGVGLLLLIPLLQLVGVDAQHGALDRVVTIFSAAFGAIGLQPTLGSVLAVYVAIVGLQSVLQRRQSVLGILIEQAIVTDLRGRVYRAIARMRWTHFAKRRASDFTQILTDEIARVGAATYMVIDLAVVVVTALVYIALALRVSPGMTGLVLGCGVVLACTAGARLREARSIGERHSAASERLHAAISDHLGSMKIARSYGNENRHAAIFADASGDFVDVSLAIARADLRLRQQLAVGSAAVLAIIVYVSYSVLAVSTAQLLVLLFLFARLLPRLTGLYQKTQSLAAALPAFAAVLDVERKCMAVAEPAPARSVDVDVTTRIDFERVTFEYGNGQVPAVRDISMPLMAGATTAIVGPSGAGKSTLADLLMGLLEPSRGRLLVDGRPLAREQLKAWRDRIGYVPQDAFLFHDTVRANLLWARPDASEDDLWQSLRDASAASFVDALPRGLNTIVGDRGVLLSGGERQRLSLARALLRRPSLLILDEATSSLDSENEARIQAAIDQLHLQMTIVIITHRLSTIRSADMIHVVDAGRLLESGTWDRLMARRSGRFRELCRAQRIEDDRPRSPAEADAADRSGVEALQ